MIEKKDLHDTSLVRVEAVTRRDEAASDVSNLLTAVPTLTGVLGTKL